MLSCIPSLLFSMFPWKHIPSSVHPFLIVRRVLLAHLLQGSCMPIHSIPGSSWWLPYGEMVNVQNDTKRALVYSDSTETDGNSAQATASERTGSILFLST